MKKFSSMLSVLVIIAGMLFAQPHSVSGAETSGQYYVPILSDMQIIDDGEWRYLIKTYEAAPGCEPDVSALVDEPFEYEGYFYTFHYASINEIMREEKKWERTEVNFHMDEDNLQAAYQGFAPNVEYYQDGFYGWLDLDYTAVWTQIEGYTNKSYTMTDSVTIAGLSSNDTSSIPKTRVKSGVTMTLQNVDWTVQESTNIGYDTVPTKYTAVANYLGAYSKKVPTGYLARALYGGYVTKTSVDKIMYTVTYAGASLALPEPEVQPIQEDVSQTAAQEAAFEQTAEPTSETTSETALESTPEPISESTVEIEQEQENEQEEETEIFAAELGEADKTDDADDITEPEIETKTKNDGIAFNPLIVAIIAVLAAACAAFMLYTKWPNVRVYTGEKDAYEFIAKRRITLKNPVIDLRGLEIDSDEVTIEVKKRAATALYKQNIQTIISDSHFTLKKVEKRNVDYWYTVAVPYTDEESGDI